ncbi:MAG: aspartate--tRNA(Asn) ligase [Christensenellales bacterium]|jgi:nondiscriminating aspartyl-tRNA synthetase
MVLKGIGLKDVFSPEMLIPEKEIQFGCCVHKIKKMGAFAFIILRTGRYTVQSVYEPEVCEGSIEGITQGCYVLIKGIVKQEERAVLGAEIRLTGIKLLSSPKEEYPLRVSDKKLGCSLDVNLQNRTVALRNPMERAVFKVAEGVVAAFKDFMLSQNFTQIHTPKIVTAGAEGGANIFKLKYFGQDAYLAQSPQVYKQTCVAFFDRVFEVGAVYRAEKHNTPRHINEYIGLDYEMGFIDSMYDVMNMEVALMDYMLKYIARNYQYELDLLDTKLPVLGEVPVVTFEGALAIVTKGKGSKKTDLDPEDEVTLSKYALEKHNSDFIFITHYPGAKRPFYAMDDPENPKLALSFDLICRGLEITTGGQRIHDYDVLVAKMLDRGMHPEAFKPYLDIFKYGMPPHGGLGIGLERVVMKFLNLKNVRQASLFPRDINHLEP